MAAAAMATKLTTSMAGVVGVAVAGCWKAQSTTSQSTTSQVNNNTSVQSTLARSTMNANQANLKVTSPRLLPSSRQETPSVTAVTIDDNNMSPLNLDGSTTGNNNHSRHISTASSTSEHHDTKVSFNHTLEEKKATSTPLLKSGALLSALQESQSMLLGTNNQSVFSSPIQSMLFATAGYSVPRSSMQSHLRRLSMATSHLGANRFLASSGRLMPMATAGMATMAGASSDDSSTTGTLIAAARSIPHPEKSHKGGEDAHFLTGTSVGVFDGVGGWAEHGIDPAEYSRALSNASKKHAKILCDSPDARNCQPRQVLQAAFEEVQRQRIIGSTTACVIAVNRGPNNTLVLKSANLGDSGFLVLRGLQIIHQSTPQTHGFNFPRQLGAESEDSPSHADVRDVTVLEGDVVVLGTDGLFDNLSHGEVVQQVELARQSQDYQKGKSAEKQVQVLADQIAQRASELASSDDAETPFAREASAHGHYWRGGKLDDITVVVAQVRQPPATSNGSTSTTGNTSTLNGNMR